MKEIYLLSALWVGAVVFLIFLLWVGVASAIQQQRDQGDRS